jgi:hypothetical protein
MIEAPSLRRMLSVIVSSPHRKHASPRRVSRVRETSHATSAHRIGFIHIFMCALRGRAKAERISPVRSGVFARPVRTFFVSADSSRLPLRGLEGMFINCEGADEY